MKVDINNNYLLNGAFVFNSDTTNYAIASFLLGYVDTSNQGCGQYLNNRGNFPGFYAQDNWRPTSRLTLNYGLRYEIFHPWKEIKHRTEQFNPSAYADGRISTVYPNAPPGLLFPGDNGMPEQGIRSIYATLMPRFGFAYDIRGNGRTVLRGGGGMKVVF